MAGKTGTTQEHKSAAFIGIVPQMSGAVITFDNSNAPKPLCDGAGAPFPCREGNIFGGKTPAETWFGTMVPLLADQPVLPLPAPDPRFLEGGAESKVPDVVGDNENEARDRLQKAGWSVSDPAGGQRRRSGHRGRPEPVRHRAARGDHRAEHQQRAGAAAPGGARRRATTATGTAAGTAAATATVTGTTAATVTTAAAATDSPPVRRRGARSQRARSPVRVVRSTAPDRAA